MPTPVQGTSAQVWANSLTNKTLAHRLGMVKDNRRALTREETNALLDEAAIRLTWADNYAKHDTGY